MEENNSKIYRCTEYKTLNKYKSFIILPYKKYGRLNNHLEKELDASISIV